MQELKLQVKKREATGKALAALRESGFAPGVVYGQGKEALSIEANLQAVERAYREAGTSQLVDLSIDDSEPKSVLFHEVQIDPLTQKLLHFDLYTVKMDEKIRTEVPIRIVGESEAIYAQGAVLVKVLEAVEVEALPRNLPPDLELDISGLTEFGQSLHIKDLKVPEGVEVLKDPEETVVNLEAPQETTEEDIAAEDAAAAEPVDLEEAVEVERGGVEEPEEGVEADAERDQVKDNKE